MKKIFYIGIIGIILFEVLNVYFIMPMPCSQRMNSIDIAYFLYSYRWFFRVFFWLMILIGSSKSFQLKHKWIPAVALMAAIAATYAFNFKMSADAMFKQPETLLFKPKGENSLSDSSIVVAVQNKGVTKAYPIRFIVYHHQVQDTIAGKPVIVTYCSVCRTGRVFEPTVKGQLEKFRLVGMDHFNAMFEDATTKSWWRQATGEAITGSLKGEVLPEVESFQMSLGKLFQLHPFAQVMQLDKVSKIKYDSLGKFERGKSKGDLTRTDSLSWKDKSWVVGIEIGNISKAYDWNQLKEKHIINDKIGDTSIVLVLSEDAQSFAAFEKPTGFVDFTVQKDTLVSNESRFDFSGRGLTTATQPLKRIKAYQEFWHSWRIFQPNTLQFDK